MNPSICLTISTFGTPEHIQLAMEVMKNNEIKVPVLVHDDSSGDKNLLNICRTYQCNFMSTSFRHGHYAGDVMALYNGLLWANKNNYDILVKMSRRFIPLFDWTKSLKELIQNTPNHTYGNRCNHFKFPLRTECVAYQVSHWLNHLEDLQKVIIKNTDSIEYDIFNIAKSYSVWMDIGNNRMSRMNNIMWHDCWKDEEYTQMLSKFKKTIPLVPNIDLAQPFNFWT